MGAAYSQWLKAREGSWSAAEISLERQLHELLLCAGPGPINHSSLMRDHSTGPAPEGMMAIERTARLASEQANTELRQRNSALLPLDEALPWCGAPLTSHCVRGRRTLAAASTWLKAREGSWSAAEISLAAASTWLKAREGSWSAAEISLERRLHELLLCAGPGPVNHSSFDERSLNWTCPRRDDGH